MSLYRAPAEPLAHLGKRGQIIVREGAKLPPVCLLCGTETNLQIQRGSEEAVLVQHSLCEPCELRARDARELSPVIFLIGGAGIVSSWTAATNDSLSVAAVMGTVMLGMALMCHLLLRGRRTVIRRRASERVVVLQNVHPVATTMLLRQRPDHGDGGGVLTEPKNV